MPILEELKIEYNELLRREDMACKYFDDLSISIKEKEIHFDEYRKIVNRLNELLTLIPHSDYNVLGGFGIEKELFAA